MGRHVVDNDSARADNCTRSDDLILPHHGADADVRSEPDLNSAGKTRSGCDVRVISDAAIVLDDGARIHKHVATEFRAGVDDRARQDLRTRTYHCAFRDQRAIVDHGLRSQTGCNRLFEKAPADRGRARAADTDDEVLGIEACQILIA
jgi:hypothetical protein